MCRTKFAIYKYARIYLMLMEPGLVADIELKGLVFPDIRDMAQNRAENLTNERGGNLLD